LHEHTKIQRTWNWCTPLKQKTNKKQQTTITKQTNSQIPLKGCMHGICDCAKCLELES